MGTQPESKLSREIMAALRARGIWCFKVHGGPFTMAGVPDIIACVPVRCCESPVAVGIFVGFETKTPTGDDPSPIQVRVHEKIRAACGQVYVPRSVSDAVRFIESIGWTRTTIDAS
jgi:hypothetical protein